MPASVGPAEGREDPQPVTPEAARELTEQLRDALVQARDAFIRVAERVRAAHRARAWAALGYGSWSSYVQAEFAMSRAQAYRLLEMANTAQALTAAAAEAGAVSPAGDTGEAVWDFGLSQRALRAIGARVDQVADSLARRLATAGPEVLADPEAVRTLVRQVVDDARRPPIPVAVEKPTASSPPASGYEARVAELRALVQKMVDQSQELGFLALEIAPGYLADDQAAEQGLTRFAEDIGSDLDTVLAARRYAITGDRRALEGTVL